MMYQSSDYIKPRSHQCLDPLDIHHLLLYLIFSLSFIVRRSSSRIDFDPLQLSIHLLDNHHLHRKLQSNNKLIRY